MERATSKSKFNALPITPQTTLPELKAFLDKAGPEARLRYEDGILFSRQDRKGSSVSHAGQYLTGQTQDKREAVYTLVKQVFKNNGIELDQHMKQVLLPHEIKHLKAGAGDLKAKHLERVFTGTVTVAGEKYQYERLSPFAKGSYGQIYKARGANDRELALKVSITPVAEQDDPVLRHETAMQLTARQAQVAELNYVVETAAPVLGHDGGVYQPMELGLCSANQLVGRFASTEDEEPVDPALALTVRDWLMSLCQINSIGMAHRDIKPENWLLSPRGVWQLSDFGTAGDNATAFQALGGKKGSHKVTGNGSAFSKAPEWLRSELPRVDGSYSVGHKADVFALGVAVFRMISNGQLPFNDPVSPATTEIDYEEQVLAYADSGQAFSQWYSQSYGQDIPLPWRDFLDSALAADPDQRADADQLRALPVFQDLQASDEAALRAQLVALAAPGHTQT